MARPTKAGLDYFPHSCIPDQRMELIEAEFGLTGYAVVLKLYEKIFVEKGYFCEWTKDVALMFSRRNGVGINVVSECRLEYWKKYGISLYLRIREIVGRRFSKIVLFFASIEG